MPATSILLVSINARYGHCAFAARSLLANLGSLREQAAILEADLDAQSFQLASEIVDRRPLVVGLSVYLWNVRLVRETLAILRRVAPRLRIVLGGPEIVEECASDWNGLADELVVGEGETAFREICEGTVVGRSVQCDELSPGISESVSRPNSIPIPTPMSRTPLASDGSGTSCTPRLILAAPENISQLVLPYDLYTDADIAHRTIFVEGSRGCPFSCAYCTSCGTGLRVVPLDRLLPALDRLLDRGVRAFRFLDRSLNASEALACGLLDFFLARACGENGSRGRSPSIPVANGVLSNGGRASSRAAVNETPPLVAETLHHHPARLQLHFEIMPCRLSESLRRRLSAFPPGVLHLEVGVQSLNETVARGIGRTVTNDTVFETLQFLVQDTRATVHADLIFGLPGEDEASFAAGFDRLVRAFDFPELQVNLLKRLPGTPLAREPRFAGLVFNPHPPYELLSSDALDFAAIGRLQQFARCWELIHNRGRFPRAAALLWQAGDASPFQRYLALVERIHAAEGRLHALGMDRLAGHVAQFLASDCSLPVAEAQAAVAADRAGT